ncbi:MAG: hypothetical protein PUH44_01190 [Bacteroidales bacterium]|nr:hypothetical protein [Bacteroidales bacterium]MDY2704700.1 hypothetical protein [Alloprevotella sp.]
MKKQYISPNASVYSIKMESAVLGTSGLQNYNNGTTVSSEELNSQGGAWTNKKDHPIWGDEGEGNSPW